jgi:SAM-dependent methyltransferase
MRVEPLPWDFDSIVAERARTSADLLDLGTGGGEWLAALAHRPARTVATESWKPNVAVARRRLEPLGIEVVEVEPAPDNVTQEPNEGGGRLPFPDGSFHLVLSRHESYVPREVARVLCPSGRFVTQQLSPGSESFADLLGVSPPATELFRLDRAIAQLESTGLDVVHAAEGEQLVSWQDVGALAWYLEAIPWALPGFDLDRDLERLRALHESSRPIEARLYVFWLDAVYR